MHIEMSVNWVIIGSGNGLSLVQYQIIIQTNAEFLNLFSGFSKQNTKDLYTYKKVNIYV